MSKKKCPKWIKDCWNYHSGFVSEIDVAVDWGEMENEWQRCWCCGHETSRLQKCHIIPKSIGGGNSKCNIVPLCSLCHDEAPDVKDKKEMFNWIKSQQNPLSGLGLGRYWHLQELIINAIKTKDNFDLPLFNKCLEDAYGMTSYHYTQSNSGPKFKKSTREWAAKKALSIYDSIKKQ